MHSNKIVESRLCTRSCRARDGRRVLEAFHCIDVRDLFVVGESEPLLPHGCIFDSTAGRRVESSMVSFQVGQAPMGKLVCAVSRRGLPGTSRDSKQRSCCDGVCEVHEIGSGGMSRRVSTSNLIGNDGSPM